MLIYGCVYSYNVQASLPQVLFCRLLKQTDR